MLDKSLKNILHETVIVINYNNKFKERMKIWKIRHVEKGDKISIFIVNIFFLIASKIFVHLEEGDTVIKDGPHIRRAALRCAPRQMQRKLWCISVNECGMQSGASTCTKRAAALILNCIRWVRTSRTRRRRRRREDEDRE